MATRQTVRKIAQLPADHQFVVSHNEALVAELLDYPSQDPGPLQAV